MPPSCKINSCSWKVAEISAKSQKFLDENIQILSPDIICIQHFIVPRTLPPKKKNKKDLAEKWQKFLRNRRNFWMGISWIKIWVYKNFMMETSKSFFFFHIFLAFRYFCVISYLHIWVVRFPKKLFNLSGMNTSKNSRKEFFHLENIHITEKYSSPPHLYYLGGGHLDVHLYRFRAGTKAAY